MFYINACEPTTPNLAGRLVWHRHRRIAPAPAWLRDASPLSVLVQQPPNSARRAFQIVGNLAVGLAGRPQLRRPFTPRGRPSFDVLTGFRPNAFRLAF